jgi:uncharacterized membrane protein
MDRLRYYWLLLNASLWFVPLLCSTFSVILALWLLAAPPTVDSGPLSAFVYGGDLRSARDLLGSLLTGMISMTALVVSITIVVLTLAAGQLGPRLIRSFTEDRVTQGVIGAFVATILYLLVVLRTIEGDGPDDTPAVAVTVGTALSAACLFVLLFYIDRLARSIVSDTIAMRVTAEATARWKDERPGRRPQPAGDPTRVLPEDEPSDRLDAPHDGYLQSVDVERLVALAARCDVGIRLCYRPGQWLVAGSELARVAPRGRMDEGFAAAVARAIVTGPSRTSVQDVAIDLQRLVEIGLRALSPGINDPFTAVAVIDNLGSCLAVLFCRDPDPEVLFDEAGVARLVRPVSTWRDLVDVAFDQVRHSGAGNPAIAIHLLGTITRLASVARFDAQREALQAQADAIRDAVRAVPLTAKDRAAIEACHRAAVERLARSSGR